MMGYPEIRICCSTCKSCKEADVGGVCICTKGNFNNGGEFTPVQSFQPTICEEWQANRIDIKGKVKRYLQERESTQ